MRNIFVALVLSVFSLMANAATFGDWESDPELDLIATNGFYNDGSMAQTTIHLDGSFWFAYYPPKWEKKEDTRIVNKTNGILKVNGQAVRFVVSALSDGVAMGTPATKEGLRFIKKAFWSSKQVTFEYEDGSGGFVSARGVQKAWIHLQNHKAI